ncbi:MAG: hypothetical protein V9E81_10435 [Marmoricola sp.]
MLRSRSDGALELRVNGVFVMDTVKTSSEIALATASLAHVDRPDRVLIGGLGLGFTLQAVIADERVRRVDVVEIEDPPSLIGCKTALCLTAPALLADPRVAVIAGDVARVIETAEASYDLILLDTDNGPGNLVHQTNAGLYESPLLQAAAGALTHGGVLTIWSSHVAPDLASAMSEVFTTVAETSYPVVLGTRQESYWLYAGSKS